MGAGISVYLCYLHLYAASAGKGHSISECDIPGSTENTLPQYKSKTTSVLDNVMLAFNTSDR